MNALFSKKNVLLACCLLLGIYAFATAAVFFLRGDYTYHDLGLINDIIANTAYLRGFFLISESGDSHFRAHITPSLLLFLPLYRIFDSQFLLNALISITVAVSLYLYAMTLVKWLSRYLPKSFTEKYPSLFWISLVCLLGLNRYVKNIFLTDHYDTFYLITFALFLKAMVDGWKTVPFLCVTAVTLGVCTQSPFFLFFHCVVLGIIGPPESISVRDWRKRLLYVFALLFFYIFLEMKVIFPWFKAGDLHSQRFWAKYGSNWFEIMLGFASSPKMLVQDFSNSAYFSLIFSFFLMPLFSGLSFLAASFPGILFFGSSEMPKRYLWYYNSSFLLPGFFITASIGYFRVLSFLEKRTGTKRALVFAGLVIIVSLGTLPDTNNSGRFNPFTHNPDLVRVSIMNAIEACPTVDSIATDFKRFVYLPNRTKKFRLSQFDDADLVLLPKNPEPKLLGFEGYTGTLEAIEKSQHYTVLYEDSLLKGFKRTGFACK